MFQLMLSLHVVGAIIAFGFGFAVPVIGRMAAAEPQHTGFWVRAARRVSDTIVIPAALSLAITGFGLLEATDRPWTEAWLVLAVLIYVAAVAAVLLVQRPLFTRVIELTADVTGPAGSSIEVPGLVARARLVGLAISAAVVVVVFLMVYKPGL